MGGKLIKIRYVEELEDGDGVQISGDTEVTTLTVRINKDIGKATSEREVFATLYHELLHCALAISGHSAGWKAEQEEPIVYGIENMMASFLCFMPKVKGMRWREVKFPYES